MTRPIKICPIRGTAATRAPDPMCAHAPYCAPVGGAHQFRPMYVPPGVALLQPPPRIAPLAANETRFLPVMRTEDGYPVPFFYYAEGCSDLYVKATRATALLADDRVHAVRLLTRSAAQAAKVLADCCAHALERGALAALPVQLARPSRAPSLDGVRSAVSGSGCLNAWLYGQMREQGLHTAVLNFEHAGGDVVGRRHDTKAEIVHVGPLYDPRGAACALRRVHGCYYCANATRSLATCTQTLERAGA